MKKQFTLFLILFFLVSCSKADDSSPKAPKLDPIATSTPRPTREASSSLTVIADGIIVAPSPKLPLSFSTSGYLTALLIAPGDSIKAEQILATIDDTLIQQEIEQKELTLASAETQYAQIIAPPTAVELAQAEASLIQAENNLESAINQRANLARASRSQIMDAELRVAQANENYLNRKMQHDQTIQFNQLGAPEEATRAAEETALVELNIAKANLQELRNTPTAAEIAAADASIKYAEAALVTAEAQLASLKAGATAEQIKLQEISVTQAEISLQQAKDSLLKTNLYAPWAGTVIAIDTPLGAAVAPGSPIMIIQDLNQLQFHTTNLTERDLAKLLPGQTATISLKSFPDQPLTGQIMRISPEAAAGSTPDNALFTIIISIDATELLLRPGMSGRVTIDLNN